jgi:putative flippase GtrA
VKSGGELLRFGLTALLMLALKLGLTHLFARGLHPLGAYLLVQAILTLVSYAAHARFTFRQARSWATFLRYARVIVLFQALDYLIFAVLLAGFAWNTTGSILAATVVIFLLRFFAVRRSFRTLRDEPAPPRHA